MIALTLKCQYALRALQVLASEYGQGPVLMPEISARAHAPVKFLQSIMVELRNAGILSTRNGRGGGYALRVSPDQITVGKIVRIIDGPLLRMLCVSEGGCQQCVRTEPCPIQQLLHDIDRAVADIIDSTPLVPPRPTDAVRS